MVRCDCCGNDIKEEKERHKVPLPFRYREKKRTFQAGEDFIAYDEKKETRFKDYDFCEDCFNAFGEMMWRCYDEETLWFNTLFPSIVFTAKHTMDKEIENDRN